MNVLILWMKWSTHLPLKYQSNTAYNAPKADLSTHVWFPNVCFFTHLPFLYVSVLKLIFLAVIGIAYLVYVTFVMTKYFNEDDEGDIRLLWLSCLGITFIAGQLVWNKCLKKADWSCCNNPVIFKARKM